jgi:hypothetical protein
MSINSFSPAHFPVAVVFLGAKVMEKQKGLILLELLMCSLHRAIYFPAEHNVAWAEPLLKHEMTLQIAQGLAYLHTARPRITHGDSHFCCSTAKFNLLKTNWHSWRTIVRIYILPVLAFVVRVRSFLVKGVSKRDNGDGTENDCALFIGGSTNATVDVVELDGLLKSPRLNSLRFFACKCCVT